MHKAGRALRASLPSTRHQCLLWHSWMSPPLAWTLPRGLPCGRSVWRWGGVCGLCSFLGALAAPLPLRSSRC